MAIEFASKDRPTNQFGERFQNVGGQYQAAKAARQTRPFGPAPRDHAHKIEETRKAEQEVAALILKARVGALLRKPLSETARPRQTTKTGRRFDLAAQYRKMGNIQEAQRQEKIANETGRDEYLGHLARQVVRKLRDPARRWESGG